VQRGDDRQSFGELVRRHQSPVRRFLRQLTRGNEALADDLAQDAFVQAHRAIGALRNEAGFQTWLFGIAHNLWRNARRRQRDQVTLEDAEASLTVPDSTGHSDLKNDLESALSRLSDDERIALHLGFAQGLSQSQIAEALSWPLGTVKTHQTRGREKLKTLLAAWNPRT
jgi:RNA polymerase sigma-70 factor (ECF subfamily)